MKKLLDNPTGQGPVGAAIERRMLSSCTTLHLVRWSLLAVALTLGACETMDARSYRIENVPGDKLRIETIVTVTLPADCLTVPVQVPSGRRNLTVSYREPSADQDGSPLKNLAHTTIYVGISTSRVLAIRIGTSDPRGGASVIVRNVPAPTPDNMLCVTATNRAGLESRPALSMPPTR